MVPLFSNIRFYILSGSTALALAMYGYVHLTTPSGSGQVVRLTEDYALLAFTFLYLSLLVSPLYSAFPKIPGRALAIKARRATGVSAFLFASLHAYLAFFDQLGGFAGLDFLTNTYLLAISLSALALLILFLLTLTSNERAIALLTSPRWKRLHQLVYIAGLAIVIHALLLGTQFSDLTSPTATIAIFAVVVLVLLEAARIDKTLQRRLPTLPRFGLPVVVVLIVLTFLPHYLGSGTGGGLNVHSQHIQLAQQAQNPTPLPSGSGTAYQGLIGDRTKRYTVGFTHPATVQANQPVQISFPVYDASSGDHVSLFSKVYGKFDHLIIVDSQLEYYNHIHADLDAQSNLTVQTSFPHDGVYHLYLDFQPFGAIEQQDAFTVTVGNGVASKASQTVDNPLSKTVGGYTVSLTASAPLTASELSVGNQTITAHISRGQTPVTDLKPYLEAFGHLTLINQQTYDFLHVHPNDLSIPTPTANSGPNVTFLPLGLYGPIKPGTYRAFAEFNPNNQLITVAFTLQIH